MKKDAVLGFFIGISVLLLIILLMLYALAGAVGNINYTIYEGNKDCFRYNMNFQEGSVCCYSEYNCIFTYNLKDNEIDNINKDRGLLKKW